MYMKGQAIPIKSSASLLSNNLDVVAPEKEDECLFAVVHKSSVWLFNPKRACASKANENPLIYKQVICKGESVNASAMIFQAKWCVLRERTLLVIASVQGAQIFEQDGSVMVFWQSLPPNPGEDVAHYARGICATGHNSICIGVSDGSILVFAVPTRGTAITLQETLTSHSGNGITDLCGTSELMASADESGRVCLWQPGGHFKKLISLEGYRYPCSSLRLWKSYVICAYGSGHMRVFSTSAGSIVAEISAHARWINALDVAESCGLLVSASEDSFVRVWKLSSNPFKIDLCYQQAVTDVQLTGAKFLDPAGSAFGVTGYDSSDVHLFKRTDL